MRVVMVLVTWFAAASAGAAAIRGRVTDPSGAPIPGALVKLERSASQGVTDANGLFTLATQKDFDGNAPVLAVTKIGYMDSLDTEKSPDATFSINLIVCADSVTDVEGNVYQAVKLGNQVWTVTNLRTKKFNDGTAIPFDAATDAWKDNTTPLYCYPKSATDTNVVNQFGLLYNFYAVETGKLAPPGWHVPTSKEWVEFETCLIAAGFNWDGSKSGDKIAKAISAKMAWDTSTVAGAIGNDLVKNNASGFSAYGTGFRHESGVFEPPGRYTGWWTSTAASSDHAGMIDLHYNQPDWSNAHHYRSACGYPVRLIKN